MIRCHLGRLIGERKLKISDVAAATGIHRHTLTRLYSETAERVDLAVMDQLCDYFDVPVGELFERVTTTSKRR
jgi:putative transcriptional regulator